ncbi:MAG: CPBP family intramembrane metalloprotease [Myxococcales bacterium]|nr:CPBP family intramembrane metalloprotease [Myxococcales bacterium]
MRRGWTAQGRRGGVDRTVAATVVLVYGGLALLGWFIGWLRGAPDVLSCTPMGLGGRPQPLMSLVGGLGLALAVIAATRALVRTTGWARELHADLRPVARSLGESAILPVALASAIGEEVLFRGALLPALGLLGSSLLFGVVHQLRGRSRGAWIAFAALVGLALGGLFAATGSLLGPIVAHALINAVNLRFLIEHDPGVAHST